MSLYEQIDLMLKGSAGSAGTTATSVLQPTGGPATSVLQAAAGTSQVTAYDRLLQMESQPALYSASSRQAVTAGALNVVHKRSVAALVHSSGSHHGSLYSQLFSTTSTVDSTAGWNGPSVVPLEVQWKQGLPAKRRKTDSQGDHHTAVPSGSDSGSGMDSGSSGLEEAQEHELTNLLQDTAPDSTIKQDASHWRSLCKGCAKAKISPWRIKRITSAKGKRKERHKLAYATWMVHTMMKPRAKSDPVAQPSSAYQVFLGAKRVHKHHCYDLEHGDIVLSAIKAITKRVIAKHGYGFMVKRRKEPFTRAMLLKILSKSLPAGT